MDRDEVWEAINAHRVLIVDLLAQLTDDEWAHPSLCTGWTVRDVAGHLAWQNNASIANTLVAMVKARGNVDRVIHDTAITWATRPVPTLVDEIRALIGTRKKPATVTHLEQLIDVLVHSQDIAVPLGRTLPLPPEAAAVAASRTLSIGFPWHAGKTFAGYHLTATDTDWSHGEGQEVEAPMTALLLTLTGRHTAMDQLEGEGATALKAHLTTH